MNKKKIFFAAQNLNIGGVQKAFINYIKKLSKSEEYEITVFSFAGGALTDKLPEDVKLKLGGRLLRLSATPFNDIKEKGGITDIFLRIFITAIAKIVGANTFYRLCFKKQKKKYDTAVSYFTDTPSGVFNKGTNLYVSEFTEASVKEAFIHTDPVFGGFDMEYCRKIYKPFDKIVCVSDAVREKFNAMLPEYAYKTETRHNVFDEEEIQTLSLEFIPFEKSKFDIVTVARVDNASKRIDGIIDICSRLKKMGVSGFKWRIVGDGPDKNKDILLANRMGVDDVIIFEGEKANQYPYIEKSDLFALFSAYEGYPLVIGEAMILKTPILTTNYAAAKEQIPKDRGIIAESDGEFIKMLYTLIDKR